MSTSNNYPNYIGVDANIINSARITLKYTGMAAKSVILNEGDLVSVGHVVNSNGKLEYAMTMGVVKSIGHDPIRRSEGIFSNSGTSPAISNPYYIVVDKSNTYASDIITIYFRDIRDIIVGPNADGVFDTGGSYGDSLPMINETNKVIYEGKFFYLNEDDRSVPDNEDAFYSKGLYYAHDGVWTYVTMSNIITSSPLVESTISIMDSSGPMPGHLLREDVYIEGSNVNTYPTVRNNVLDGITFDSENSAISVVVVGDMVMYQLNLTGVVLPTDPVPDIPDTGEGVLITYEGISESYKEVICKPEYYLPDTDAHDPIPSHTTPILSNRVSVNGEYYNVYHKIDTDGNIVIHYPNVEGITELNISGSYIK